MKYKVGDEVCWDHHDTLSNKHTTRQGQVVHVGISNYIVRSNEGDVENLFMGALREVKK